MLESLQVRNFKRHEHFDAVFPDGLTICTGNNYKGKSSILQAVLFALFGVSAVPGGSKLAVRRGSSPGSMSVRAVLYHNGHQYQVERSANNASLHRDGELIASSKSAVNSQLEEVLGTPQKFFMRLKYAEQGETQALLTMGAEELHKVVEHVSGASIVNEVIVKASRLASAAIAKLEEVGPIHQVGPLEEQGRALAAQYKEMRATEVVAEAKMSEVVAAHDEATKQYTQALQFNRALEQQRTLHEQQTTQLQVAKAELEQVKKVIAQYTAAADRLPEVLKVYVDLNKVASAHVEGKRQRQEKQDSLDALSDEIQDSEATLRKHLSESQKLGVMADLDSLYQQAIDGQSRVTQWETEVRRLQAALDDGVCQSCHRPFENLNVEQVTRQRDEAQANWQQTKEWAAGLTEAHREATQRNARIDRAADAIYTVRDVLQPGLRSRYETMLKEFGAIERELDALDDVPAPHVLNAARSQWLEANTARDTVDRSIPIQRQAEAQIQHQTQALSESGGLSDTEPKDLTVLHNQAEAERRVVKSHQLKLEVLQRNLMQIKFDLDQKLVELKQAQATAARSAELVKERDTSKRLVKYLKTNRDRFMVQLWEQVMGYASDFASACTGGAIAKVLRTEAGAFEFVEAGESLPLAAASGAQKSIMSIGVQLAFDALLPDSFGALLLDEPTSQMDEDHALTLTEMLANSGRQIIMVSHRERDAALAQAHINLS